MKTKNEVRKSTKPVILVAILLLLIFVFAIGGNTFARYISTKTVATQTATVAKWGYVISVQNADLFGSKYNASGVADGAGVSVVASDENNKVVAPGTHSDPDKVFKFTVSGSAEVLASLTFTVGATDIVLTKTDVSLKYHPIVWKWKLNGASEYTSGTMAELKTALENLSVASNAANTSVDISGEIAWEWAFNNEGAEPVVTNSNWTAGDYGSSDTILGAIAAGKTVDGYTANTTVSFGLEIKVEQIQSVAP